MTDAARSFPRRPLAQVAPFEENLPGIRGSQARQDIQKRALTCSIQSHQDHELTGIGRELDGIENRMSRISERYISNGEQAAHGRFSFRLSFARINSTASITRGPGVTRVSDVIPKTNP